jgi:hypothetical protein
MDGPNEGEQLGATNDTASGPYAIVGGEKRPIALAPTPPGWTNGAGAARLNLRTSGLLGVWGFLTTTDLEADPPTADPPTADPPTADPPTAAMAACVKAWRDAPERLRDLPDLQLYHVDLFLKAHEGRLASGAHTGASPPQPGSIMARLCSAVIAENERRQHAAHRDGDGDGAPGDDGDAV